MVKHSFHLAAPDRVALQHLLLSTDAAERLKRRVQILLMADKGSSASYIAYALSLHPSSVPQWLARYENLAPGKSVIDVVRTWDAEYDQKVNAAVRTWVKGIAMSQDGLLPAEEILQTVQENADKAGFPQLADISLALLRMILRDIEVESSVLD